MIIFDSGYYAKAPTNLTTTFNASGVTLQWEDTGNNCTSTVYQVMVISCSCTSTSVLMYNTSNTTLHINSSDLLDNVIYTYTVRGWNEQQSNNSEPFTIADTTNTIDPCKNNICCADVTLNTVLVSSDTCSKHSSQYYNNSITGNIPVTESKIDNSETYYVSSTPTTNFSPSNDPMTSQPPGHPDHITCIIVTVLLIVLVLVAVVVVVVIIVCVCLRQHGQRHSHDRGEEQAELNELNDK